MTDQELADSDQAQKAAAQRIKGVRKSVGLTQEQFAKALGVTRGAVGNWERGLGIKTANIRLIAETFGFSVASLISGEVALAPGGDGLVGTVWLDRIKRSADESGRSYRQISHDVGLGPNFVSQMLQGERAPSFPAVIAICRSLGLPLSDLVNDPADERKTKQAIKAAFDALGAMGEPITADRLADLAVMLRGKDSV